MHADFGGRGPLYKLFYKETLETLKGIFPDRKTALYGAQSAHYINVLLRERRDRATVMGT